jgi:nitrous oxidase accessory protein
MRGPASSWEPWVAALIVLLLLFTIHDAVIAAERTVTAADDLHEAVAAAAPGDTLHLAPGVHPGNLRIDRPLTLSGAPGAVLDAGGHGDVIRVAAPDVTLRGLTIRRSGRDLTAMNAGVFVEKQAARVRIEDNTLEDISFGIWLDGSADAAVIGNRIRGDAGTRSQDRGNGIHLFNTTGAEILDNTVREVRDGIYIDVSNGNTLRGNTLRDLRYGIHYMYSHHNEVAGNLTRNTRTGYALMQSKFLTVTGNRSERDQNYGILMNFITNSTVAGNVVVDVQRGRSPGVADAHGIPGAEGKALFVYNSQYNTIHDNRFETAEIGIHLTAGSEDNRIHRNAFVANREQVKYVANREQEWSFEGVGNYWSDYLGWDLDADGIGDRPHEPNDAVDKLLWRHPEAKLLLNSPAVVTLRWVQHQFPVLRPLGVRDSAPLMAPPVQGEG